MQAASLFLAVSLVAILALPAVRDPGGRASVSSIGSIDTSFGVDAAATLPASFVENAGQLADASIRYYSSAGHLHVGLANGSVLLAIADDLPPTRFDLVTSGPSGLATVADARGLLVRIAFQGARAVEPVGRVELPFRSSYFAGNDPAGWHVGVRRYGQVVYENLYEGIDLVYRADSAGLKYDFIVHPGADPSRILLTYEGVEDLQVDTSGDLSLRTELGLVRDSAPRAFQGSHAVSCSFALRDRRSVGFDCAPRDASLELRIDPLVYSTRLGGTDDDVADGVAVDPSGNAYLLGTTWSAGFPTTPGVIDRDFAGPREVFVAKLNPGGTALVYSTYLSGGGTQEGSGIAVDPAGNAYVTGFTSSPNFPTTAGAYDVSYNGYEDGFFAKLNPTGTALLYSTYVGGRGEDLPHGIAIDGNGGAYIAGYTNSTNFPTTPGSYEPASRGGYEGFVAKLNPTGTALAYSTYLGGSSADFAVSIAVDAAGSAYVTGGTLSSDYPTTPGAFGPALNGSYDAFVTKLSPEGSALSYSSFLGGRFSDQANVVALDPAGDAYVVGNTISTNFPTTPGAFDRVLSGNDGFVAKVNPSGTTLLYSTLLGGVSIVYTYALAVDASGNAFVTGATRAMDFPVTADAFDVTYNGEFDAYLTEFSADGSRLVYSTFLGALQDDVGLGVAVDASDNAYLVGRTSSDAFPTTLGAYDTSSNGMSDAFVAKFSPGGPPGFGPFLIVAVLLGAALLAVAILIVLRTRRRPPPPTSAHKPGLAEKVR